MKKLQNRKSATLLLSLPASIVLSTLLLAASPLAAQVLDADCFSGACGGETGIPECPEGFEQVGRLLYANSKANAAGDCETVVSCTNLNKDTVELSCRFHHGFFSIRPGGPGEALCNANNPNLRSGDTGECSTDGTGPPNFQAAGMFLAGSADCPPFEGKGLVCVKGGDARRVLCQAHLSCGNGTTLERIDIVRPGREERGRKRGKGRAWNEQNE